MKFALVFSVVLNASLSNAGTLTCVSGIHSLRVQQLNGGIRFLRSDATGTENRFFPKGAAFWQIDSDGSLVMLSVSKNDLDSYAVYLGASAAAFSCRATR